MSLLDYVSNKSKQVFPSKSIATLVEGISTVPNNSLPIAPKNAEWVYLDAPERLVRRFSFERFSHLSYFLNELLDYQEYEQHHARVTIEGNDVTVETYTHDIERVTLSDKKLAALCDELYADTKLLNYSER